MNSKFKGSEIPLPLKEKTVLIVDDGMATGNSILATLLVVRKSHPSKTIVAVPIASEQAVKKIKLKADQVVTIHIPDEFYGVGEFYQDFEQVSDTEVIECFQLLKKQHPSRH